MGLKLDTYKTIGDAVHGSIPVTKTESDILQLPVLNRLHHIKQMSMAYYVFPGAQISRFAHSIGALYVGGLIASKLIYDLSNDDYQELFPTYSRAEVLQIVRIACMLHDVGHGPFSHDSEDLMRLCLKEEYSSELETALKLFSGKSVEKLSIHEYYSYMLITKSEIASIIESAGISANAVGSLLCKEGDSKFWTKQGFQILKKMVSSQLDADRMDYLLRDAYATGVPYGTVDIHRLVSNLLILKNQIGRQILAIHERAQSTIEHILNARFMMYKWVYTHHMVVACEELMKNAIVRLIDLEDLDLKDLHWSRFAEGLVEDTHVWQRLLQSFQSKPSELLAFKGLIDRRFLPNSILKRPLDYTRLMSDIVGESDTGGPAISREKVSRFFSDPVLQKKLGTELELRKEPIRNCVILAVHKPRSPYSPLSSDDRVMIYYSRGQKSARELTEVSTYFDRINEEWTSFPDVYFAYLIPGVSKAESAHHLDEIRSALVSFVASEA